MASIHDDMLYYFRTPAGHEYRSVWVNLKTEKVSIVPISEDEFWSLVKEGNLQMAIIEPPAFPHELPPNIIGNVNAFVI